MFNKSVETLSLPSGSFCVLYKPSPNNKRSQIVQLYCVIYHLCKQSKTQIILGMSGALSIHMEHQYWFVINIERMSRSVYVCIGHAT